jgi:FAD/FMN-containing dehydrogenase
MVDQHVITTNGASATLSETDIEELRNILRGRLIRPLDDGYEEARKIHNGMIDRHPGLIVRCAGVADVISVVNFARANNLLVSVRGGGHNVVGFAVCDGGLVIDLSDMKGLHIDPKARTARAEPGVTWGELNHDLHAFSLGATGGYASITGVPGLTLGGGFGWLVRKYGLACDNLLSADVVTADGRFLTANARENADLFWGLRGGGGNFGIVTSFEFKVYPVDTVLAGIVIYPFNKAEELLKLFREHVAMAPDELTWGAALLSAPPAPFLPAEVHGKPVVAIALVYDGPIDAGEEVVRPFREFGPPLADVVHPMPYTAAQKMADDLFPPGFQNYWKGSFLKDLSDDAIDILRSHFSGVPSPHTVLLIDHNGGGAISRVGENDSAFGHRGWTYNFVAASQWPNPEDSEANIQWTREMWDAMQPHLANAVYVNYLGESGEESIKAAYSAGTRDRLAELKKTYDPTNFFHMNQNIRPAA